MKRTISSLWAQIALLVAFFAVLSSGSICIPPPPPAVPVAPFMKMDPAPDSDKPLPVPAGDNSCWLHTAANMLAGAGYGTGTTVQARADDIWADMNSNYGTANGGWIDTALQWWLQSANNAWTANPCTVVTVYGNKVGFP